ncbi:hypothetical protein D024_3923 [Vibrio parahaemolyticus 3259]|nr:hypothetical protein D024_3923 [Vibrio parahaemolyticus 3259]ETJ94341.1 hypothetical protein D041_0660 [Vibrio parahaemolyticus EKP-008]
MLEASSLALLFTKQFSGDWSQYASTSELAVAETGKDSIVAMAKYLIFIFIT